MSIEKVVDVIRDALEEFAQEVRDETLREVESNLRVAVGGNVKAKPGRPPKAAKGAKPVKRGRPTKATVARRLQGRYMGMLRAYNAKEKAGFKRIREEKGTEAAIAAMEKAGHDGKVKPRNAKRAKVTPITAKGGTSHGRVPRTPKNDDASLANAVAKASKDADVVKKDAPAPQGA